MFLDFINIVLYNVLIIPKELMLFKWKNQVNYS